MYYTEGETEALVGSTLPKVAQPYDVELAINPGPQARALDSHAPQPSGTPSPAQGMHYLTSPALARTVTRGKY